MNLFEQEDMRSGCQHLLGGIKFQTFIPLVLQEREFNLGWNWCLGKQGGVVPDLEMFEDLLPWGSEVCRIWGNHGRSFWHLNISTQGCRLSVEVS